MFMNFMGLSMILLFMNTKANLDFIGQLFTWKIPGKSSCEAEAWDGTRLVHIDEDGIKRSIGRRVADGPLLVTVSGHGLVEIGLEMSP